MLLQSTSMLLAVTCTEHEVKSCRHASAIILTSCHLRQGFQGLARVLVIWYRQTDNSLFEARAYKHINCLNISTSIYAHLGLPSLDSVRFNCCLSVRDFAIQHRLLSSCACRSSSCNWSVVTVVHVRSNMLVVTVVYVRSNMLVVSMKPPILRVACYCFHVRLLCLCSNKPPHVGPGGHSATWCELVDPRTALLARLPYLSVPI